MSRARDLADSADLSFDGGTFVVDQTHNRVGINQAAPAHPVHVGTDDLIVDASGILLVGTTDTVPSNNGAAGDAGVAIIPDGVFRAARSGNVSLDINRMDSDGEIAAFRKNGSTVGDIGVNNGDNLRIQGNSSHSGVEFGTNAIFPHKNGSNVDATIDLGESSLRWKDLYISNRLTNAGTGGVRIDGNDHAYIRKKGTHQYQFDCGSFTAGQAKKIFTTGSWTAGGGSITVFQNAGFFGVGQFSFILHYGGCAFTLQHGTSNYATFSVNLNTPGSGQTEVYLTMGYAMTDVRIFLNFDGYPYYGSGALVGSAGSGITMTEVAHHSLA